MGFFSSRKAEPTPLSTAEQKSSVNVIRSRFYGRKNRNSLINSETTSNAAHPGLSAPMSPTSPASQRQSPLRHETSIQLNQSPIVPRRQVSTDALTMSLAERLNDLATANADGLLDDEEYRLLRQNVFERYAADPDSSTTTSTIPIGRAAARDSTLPQARPRPPRAEHPPQQHRHSRAPSVAPSNASIHSQRSITTAVSSIFRRATGRSSHSVTTPTESGSVEGSMFSMQQTTDASSIYSASQMSMSPRTNTLSRRPSNDSLMSGSQHGGSISGHDMRSTVSRRRVPYASSISSRATTRSAKPPSSFHLRFQSTSSAHPTRPNRTHEGDDDEDSPKTAAELREEIETVEAEGRKLLDAFNGLELTALTKSRTSMSLANPARLGTLTEGQHLSVYSDGPASALGSSYTLVPDPHGVPLVAQPVNLKRKGSVVTTITGSFRSSSGSERRGAAILSPSTTQNGSTSSNRNSINGKSFTTVNGLLSSSPPLTSSRSHPNLNGSAHPSPALPAMPITPNRKRSILRPAPKRPLLPSSLRNPNSSSSSTPTPDASLSNRPSPDFSSAASPPPPEHPSSKPIDILPSKPIDILSSKPSRSHLEPISASPTNTNPTILSTNTTTNTSTNPSNPSKTPATTNGTAHSNTSPSRRTAPPDPALIALEEELGDIRRRKAEVATRYEQRLEFLRAKLKNAEIRERLAKR